MRIQIHVEILIKSNCILIGIHVMKCNITLIYMKLGKKRCCIATASFYLNVL